MAHMEFPKIRGTFFWGCQNKDYSRLESTLGSPFFWGNYHLSSTKYKDSPERFSCY